MDKKKLDCLSFIKSSKNRIKIIKSIGDDFKMPSEISKDTSIRLNHVSALLSELKNNDVVICLNEDKSKGRFYSLTNLGKDVLTIIMQQNKKE